MWYLASDGEPLMYHNVSRSLRRAGESSVPERQPWHGFRSIGHCDKSWRRGPKRGTCYPWLRVHGHLNSFIYSIRNNLIIASKSVKKKAYTLWLRRVSHQSAIIYIRCSSFMSCGTQCRSSFPWAIVLATVRHSLNASCLFICTFCCTWDWGRRRKYACARPVE